MRPFLAVLPLALLACEKQPAFIKVKVPQDSMHSVRMDPVLPPFVKKGDTLQLRASAFQADKSYLGPAKQVKWSSSDPAVALVSLDGLVTIVSSGKAEISAETVGYDAAHTAKIGVEAIILDKIEVVPPPEIQEGNKFHMGEILMFTAKVTNDRGGEVSLADLERSGQKLHWKNVGWAATIAINGEVEGRAIGEGQLLAEAGELSGRLKIEVLDWKPEKKRR